MKQTLSVADFATILYLVNREIAKIEYCLEKSPQIIVDSQLYQDLQHIKQSLQNLNIEVETPKVEVETNEP